MYLDQLYPLPLTLECLWIIVNVNPSLIYQVDIKTNFKLGRKYTPFCELAFKTELRKFDSEVLGILPRNFFPQVKTCLSVSVLFHKLKKIKSNYVGSRET